LADIVSVLTWTLAAFFLASTILIYAMRMFYCARSLTGSTRRGLLQLVGFFLIFKLNKVGYVEKRVSLQSQIDKCRLHAGQNACHSSVVNGTREGVLVFAFVVDFRELIVFQNRKPRLMRRAGNANFFCHRTFPSGSLWLSVHAARSNGARTVGEGMDGRITGEMPRRRPLRAGSLYGRRTNADVDENKPNGLLVVVIR
jgi:hypothetical protein